MQPLKSISDFFFNSRFYSWLYLEAFYDFRTRYEADYVLFLTGGKRKLKVNHALALVIIQILTGKRWRNISRSLCMFVTADAQLCFRLLQINSLLFSYFLKSKWAKNDKGQEKTNSGVAQTTKERACWWRCSDFHLDILLIWRLLTTD